MSSAINSFYSSLRREIEPTTLRALATLGFALTLRFSLKLLSSLYKGFIAGGQDLLKKYGPGSWALITGPTAGVGSAFARELARLGFNLVLVGRNQEHLDCQAQELRANYGPNVHIRTIQADLSRSGEDGFIDSIFNQVKDLDISILINNAGPRYASLMHEHKDSEALETMVVHTIAPVLLVRKFLHKLLQRPRRSAVINVSSVAGVYPTPGMSFYSGGKSLVDMFTRALDMQYGEKIDFLSFRDSAVKSRKGRLMTVNYAISNEEAARGCLARLGAVSHTYGHWKHQIHGALYSNRWLGKIIGASSMEEIKQATPH